MQFAEFARRLHARGANVLVPRLPHHGHADRMTDALARLQAEELDDFSERTLQRARMLGERVTVAGFSLGGLLACRIAQREQVARVVAIAPFLGLAFSPGGSDRVLLRAALALPNRFLWWHPLLREKLGPAHGYPRYATHAAAQAFRLSEGLFAEAAREAPRASEIVLVSNRSETTVSNAAIVRLARVWRRHARDRVSVHRLTGLPPSHDIIEPLRSPKIVARVYPELIDLVDR
jgi:pimeloyl-ACP methyl ester carboxylesterase